ncbi:MAG: hypothetical protein E5W97_21500 [Mesorhizobium sp.]|nr:MAG: hypothetical protein E5W97_21500 [Mesorhizobium sp.]
MKRKAHARFCWKPQVTTRTTPTVVRLNAAFLLPGFDAPQPAAEYRVDLEEESLEGFPRWRCVATFVHLPAIREGANAAMARIEPTSLEAAIDNDWRQP